MIIEMELGYFLPLHGCYWECTKPCCSRWIGLIAVFVSSSIREHFISTLVIVQCAGEVQRSYSQDFTVNKADEPLRDERATGTRVSSSQIHRLMREGSLQTGFNWSGGELGGQPLTEWTQETFRLAPRLIKSDSRSQNALKTHKQKPTCSYSASGRHFRRLFYFYALLSNYSYLCLKG